MFDEYGYQYFRQRVNPRSSAAEEWNIHRRNDGMITAGVCGGITGYGADLLGIDDPFKGAAEAQGEPHREKVWNWYLSEAYSRLSPEGAIVITNMRWHRGDLSGRLLKQQFEAAEDWVGQRWEVLNLPAIAEDQDDALGRQIDEPLWPERWTLPKLLEKKRPPPPTNRFRLPIRCSIRPWLETISASKMLFRECVSIMKRPQVLDSIRRAGQQFDS